MNPGTRFVPVAGEGNQVAIGRDAGQRRWRLLAVAPLVARLASVVVVMPVGALTVTIAGFVVAL